MIFVIQLVLIVLYSIAASVASAKTSHDFALLAFVVLGMMLFIEKILQKNLWAIVAMIGWSALGVYLYRSETIMVPLLLVPTFFLWVFAYFFLRPLMRGQPSLITRISAEVENVSVASLPAPILRYTKGLSWVWGIALFVIGTFNLILACITVPGGVADELGYAPAVSITPVQWTWIANLGNYGIVAGIFIVEFIVRKRLFPERYASFVEFARKVGRIKPAFWQSIFR